MKHKLREKIFKWIFLTGDKYRLFITWFSGLCRFCFTVTLSLFILSFIFYIGFARLPENIEGLKTAFRYLFLFLFLSKYLPEVLFLKKIKGTPNYIRIFLFLYLSGVFISNFNLVSAEKPLWRFFHGNTSILIAIFLIIISEISGISRRIRSVKIPPGLIFSSGFLLIIIIGSGLLMMPKAHTGSLSYIDSLFTSVSAVCVTGLIVVDTSTSFTTLGKIIILCLIQVGGIGIMTFTGFFSYIFTAGSSFRDRLLLKEVFSSESLNNLFKILIKIILITLLTEIAGALIIYSSLDYDFRNKTLFSIFHAVSAFCNAGFSTLTDNLTSGAIKINYILQITIAFLIILGGIGFPVLMSVYSYFKHLLVKALGKIMRKRTPVKPGQRIIPTTIVLVTTAILIIGGTVLYYVFESGNSLSGEDTIFGKILISFFGSVSARTAGFNITDITKWCYPTIFLMIFLMWVGASPGSTGGGIKTTTFALAVRSAWNNIRGKERMVIGNREISNNTIIRVLSIIILSLIIISAGFFILLVNEPGKDPVHLLFECFSAYGTVGLSMANSSTFSDVGKITDMILMFVGRVGPLTILTGILFSYRKSYSQYPETDIVIN